MTRPQARTAALCLGLLLADRFLAADTVPPPAVAPLILKDGRVLHHARIIADEGDSVVFRSDEGLIKTAKANLPQGVALPLPAKPTPSATPQMVMQVFNPDPPDAVAEPDGRPKAKPKPKAPAVPAEDAPKPMVFKGCTLVSFQPKSFQNAAGCAEVVIRNDTAAGVDVFPGDLVCVTTDGTRHTGSAFATDGFPPILKRRELVPAGGQIDDTVIFTSDPLDLTSVTWAR